MDKILDRFNDARSYFTDQELLEFIVRRSPKDADEFIRVLYADIERIISDIEAVGDSYQGHSEEQLRDALLVPLKHRGYNAEAESKSRGRTDLLVKCTKINLVWIGEAKIHGAYEHLAEGMKQLFTRYSTGRHKDVGFIVFIFAKDGASIFKKWQDHLVAKNVCNVVGSLHINGDFSFLSEHRHEGSGTQVMTRHFGVLLHFEPTDKSGRKTRGRSRTAHAA